ncbi:MAG: prepilin-type N-terminal cleavage/methylation domain-containing protein [Phycisphaeraceae bacterium]|nr:prepilin-type N-terminal cleavage/methylation domain-containing protein [Phycisphaeraceae bacterium]
MRTHRHARRIVRGFSLIEMMVALAISAALLTASLAALDTSFKSYQQTSDTASTHVVTRIVAHRVLTMIRTGHEFAPYPIDVLDLTQNPMFTNTIEFVSAEDEGTNFREITRIYAELDPDAANGSQRLMLTIDEFLEGVLSSTQTRVLLRGVLDATFTLEYDIGPRLRRATIDLTVESSDVGAASLNANWDTPSLRLVASASPRRLQDR